MTSYTTRDAADLIGLPVSSVRSWVRSGILSPERGPRGEFRFSFRDLVLLKASRGIGLDRAVALLAEEAP